MAQQSSHSVFSFAVALLVSLGCNRMENRNQSTPAILDFAFSQLETVEDVQQAVDAATSHSNAILFIHVDWAPMTLQRKRFAKFEHEYKKTHSESDLGFCYVDCTSITEGYKPLRALAGWKQLEQQKNGASLVNGHGELVWFMNGHVLNVEQISDFKSTAALIVKTETLGNGNIAE